MTRPVCSANVSHSTAAQQCHPNAFRIGRILEFFCLVSSLARTYIDGITPIPLQGERLRDRIHGHVRYHRSPHFRIFQANLNTFTDKTTTPINRAQSGRPVLTVSDVGVLSQHMRTPNTDHHSTCFRVRILFVASARVNGSHHNKDSLEDCGGHLACTDDCTPD